MNPTSVFWADDKYARPQYYSSKNIISGHLGIDFVMPKQGPVTAGWYFNQNQPLATANPKMTNSAKPEYFVSGDGVIPTVAGRPREGIFAGKFSRTYR